MGQLIIKYGEGNSNKDEVKLEITLPDKMEKELKQPKEVIVNGTSYVVRSVTQKI